MEIEIINEYGLLEALEGITYSYGKEDELDKFDRMELAKKLSRKGNGEGKFLESIVVWLRITAPRYWWQQFDTYRVGVSKQSESTMHTILKKEIWKEDFEKPIPEETLVRLNKLRIEKKFDQLKVELPEGFLQKRMVCLNYKTIQNMILQRKTHRLPEWQKFCEQMKFLEHYALLMIEEKVEKKPRKKGE